MVGGLLDVDSHRGRKNPPPPVGNGGQVGVRGLEPLTSSMSRKRSSQLS